MQFTNTIAPDGSFTCQLFFDNPNGAKMEYIAGEWSVKNGFYINTVTNDSNTRHKVPRTASARIIVANANEYILASMDSTNNEVWKSVGQ